jgi:hypothetical protein
MPKTRIHAHHKTNRKLLAPFRVSADYVEWAHGGAAEEGQPLATKLDSATVYPGAVSGYKLFDDPQLVAEIADVAELFVGGDDNNLRAASVRARAVTWLETRGLTVKGALQPTPCPPVPLTQQTGLQKAVLNGD